MLAPLRLVLLAASFAAVGYGDDITIQLDGGGSVEILDPQFIRVDQFNIHIPELSFTIVDKSASPWTSLKLQFDMGGFCNGEVRQWSTPVDLSRSKKFYHIFVESLRNKLQFCRTEIITAQIVGSASETPKFTSENLMAHQRKRLADEAEEKRLMDEANRIAAAEKAKKEAAEATRKKRVAAEQKKKDEEMEARLAARRAEEDAKAADERRKIRAACVLIYKNTIDKKISDLTVREEQQVRACQALGLYAPH